MATVGEKDVLVAPPSQISCDQILSEYPFHWFVWNKDASSIEEELALARVRSCVYFCIREVEKLSLPASHWSLAHVSAVRIEWYLPLVPIVLTLIIFTEYRTIRKRQISEEEQPSIWRWRWVTLTVWRHCFMEEVMLMLSTKMDGTVLIFVYPSHYYLFLDS